MIKYKSKTKHLYVFVFSALVFLFKSCFRKPDNTIVDKNFENMFSEKIKLDNSVFFDFQYDLLTSQKAYFVDNQLKYLTFKHSPEVGFVECRLAFDLVTDSIDQCTIRKVLPSYQKSGDGTKIYDTVFVFYPKRHSAEIFYANELLNTVYRNDIFNEQMPFIKNVVSSTQNEFNSRRY